MTEIMSYVKPELLLVTAVLYFIGTALKRMESVPDKYIPLLLGAAGISICALYVFATCGCGNRQEIAMAFFVSITQGILVAGLSTYVHQIIKQAGKEN